jgi:hypothetical protein
MSSDLAGLSFIYTLFLYISLNIGLFLRGLTLFLFLFSPLPAIEMDRVNCYTSYYI